jgi:hypothetical protein
LLLAVKIYEFFCGSAVRDERLPSAIAKDPLHKVFSEPRITEATFFFHGQEREFCHQGLGKKTTPLFAENSLRSKYLNSFHTAARRILLEDISGKAHLSEPSHPLLGITLHFPRPVLP